VDSCVIRQLLGSSAQQIDNRRIQASGDRIQRHYGRIVDAALSSADDVEVNSRLGRERGLRDADLLATPSNLRADAPVRTVFFSARDKCIAKA
jgi:hypothetical protein